MKLKDKTAIVTGGARGIGKAISKLLAQEGCQVTIVNVSKESGEAALREFSKIGIKVDNLIADVSQENDVNTMVRTVADRYGHIDILVNNAGVTRDNLILRMKMEQWNEVIDINLKGTFNCIKAVSRYMMKARYGRIINITSVVGLSGNSGQANYAASKAGVLGLTKSAARELAARNINVNSVAPGYIDTDMTEKLLTDAKDTFLDNIPLKRPGTPHDVACLVCFLASDDASYITGQTINVDGGMIM